MKNFYQDKKKSPEGLVLELRIALIIFNLRYRINTITRMDIIFISDECIF